MQTPVQEIAGPGPLPRAPFPSPEGYFIKRRRRIRGFPFVRQIDATDCGAAGLAMVCRHFGRAVSLARLRQLLHTSTDGTSLQALCRTAAELGLAARAIKTTSHTLSHIPLPAIVHWEGNHWVVLYEVDTQHVRLADPALGLRHLRRDVFEAKWTGYAALFDYTTGFVHAPEERSSMHWLWPFVRPFIWIVSKAVGLAMVVSALQMVFPIFTQIIVDRVLVEQNMGMLHMLIAAMLVVALFMTMSLVVQRYLLSFAAVRIDTAVLDFLTRTLLALPMPYFYTRRTGDIQRRLAGIRQVREFMVQHGVSGLTALAQLSMALALMGVYSPLLTLVFLATSPLYMLMMRISARWLRPLLYNLEEVFGTYHSCQIDAIKGIETVKALGAEHALRAKMLQEFHGVARRMFTADFTMLCYQGAIQTITFLTTVLFWWIGAQQVLQGTFTVGALVAFQALVVLANGPIGSLLSLWDNLQMVSVLLNRVQDVLIQEPEQGADHTRLGPVSTLRGHIRLHNMGFRYGGPESPPILDGITLDIPVGARVALVGRSGSGKTTLIKCLAGLLEPTTGTIFYDGRDLTTLNYRDLRRQIGFVLQENYLFDDTIAHNIAFGEEEPDMDQVMWAAQVANAHAFIVRLPLGYDTRIGETGMALSGGQRQRLAIARALYHRPPVLLFDEATSHLDTESERAVKENLTELFHGRTALVIAHRLSTIRDADCIVVLEQGRIVEQGTHAELMQCQGLYSYLGDQHLEV
jgi:ATP-binding cassette subfamily B protein